MVGYEFFDSSKLFYEKGPYGVFFHGHSDSLNMNDTELTFIGLVKLNIERPSFGNKPLLSQVRKTYEFGLIFGRATTSVCYPLWTRKNEKRHSSIMMGELREGKHFCKSNGSRLSPLNMALVYISFSQLGIQLTNKSIHFHESCHSFESFKRMHCSLSHCVSVWSSHAAKSFVMPPNVQRKN